MTFWRVFAVVVFIAILGAAGPEPHAPRGPHVARVWLTGLLASDPAREELLAELAGDDDVEAVLLRIDSPGGTVTGSEILFQNLRKLAEDKPVVAVLGEVAASGGYIAALGADRIFARGNTMTASIGVIMQYPKLDGLMDKIGVEMHELKSSPLKAEPSPFGETPEAALEIHRAMIADGYAWFRGLVAERRGLSGAALDAVADGRVMSGRMALEAGLIDALGGEAEAAAWLEAEHAVTSPVLDAEIEEEEEPMLLRLLLGQVGFGTPESVLDPETLPMPAQRALMGRRLMAVLP
ncbi:signal peptide peptidase SppA [Rhodovulum sp. DZ06]|uniref:signal peptide peptidase SppA n=1 Tax=Rhodovulum sp. DZ06 TaxID=3425126 RepID=UPI003D350ED9